MDIAQLIKQRAQERGVDPELALAIAKAESGLRPQIKNPKSSAHGLFQIVDDTWKQYGGDPKKRKDVNENIRIGLEILADNERALGRTLGREPRPGELYAAHFFGTEGAKRVLTANPDAPVSSVVSERVLKANPELLQGKSVYQALSALGAKVGDTGPGQRVPRSPDPKTARPTYREDPSKPPVISNAIDATNQYGPGYQAALALSYLTDTEEESDDPDAQSVVEREARAEMEDQAEEAAQAQALAESSAPRASSMLAEMDFGYAPVVGQPKAPVRLAAGGEVSENYMIDFATGKPIKAPGSAYLTAGGSGRSAPVDLNPGWSARTNEQKAQYYRENPAMAAATRLGQMAFGTTSAGMLQRMVSPEFVREQREIAGGRSPETGGSRSIDSEGRSGGYEGAINNRMSQREMLSAQESGFAEGGEVTDPEAAMFAGRGDVPAKPNMTGRELAQQALYGVGDLPYVVAGAPVDLAAMAMAPFGYKDPKPFMGSADIKARMTRAGIRPADTTDPRLQGPRMASEMLASLTNPAGVTRSVARGAQALESSVMSGAQRAEKALEPVVTRTMERGGKAAELLQALSPAPAQAMPGKVGAPAKPAAFTPLPTAEAPFVGRLDQFAAGMQSPMKKEQLLGTLKGKFKDYEIERARVALQDMPDDAKVMPTDFLNRLNEVHNPAGFRTTVLEPKVGSYYQTMDNVFVDGENTPPMGVIHLTKFVDPSAAARFEEVSRADSQLLTLSRGGNMWGSKLDTDAVEKWADSQPDGFHIKNLLNSRPVQQAKEFNENSAKVQDAADFLLFPGVGKAQIPDIPYPRDAQGYIDFVLHNRLRAEAAQQVRQQGKEMWKALGLPPDLLRDPPGLDPNMPFTNEEYKGAIMDAMREYRNQMRVKAQDAVYPVMDDLGRLRERVAVESPYMGQHSSLQNAPMPIAFSRYTEREAVIPGMGKAKGIYVHELQSDLLDDVRKKGAKGGSQTKDYAELKQVEEKLANRAGMDDSEAYSLLGRRRMLEQRLDRSPYTPEANYSLDEAIPNMEQSPQVVQQLMVKNAVSAAIQRGDQFVAFPGKESAQAQLYEKLPRNLDAVVKDLGPGFEKRSIEMTLPNGEPAMFNAIVWAPEAAQKLQKSGIPFAKGGMVERNNHDNRSYK